MANSIDQLSIEIVANSEKAEQAIDRLIGSLGRLSDAIKSINTKSMATFANSMESLSRTGTKLSESQRDVEKFARTIAENYGIKTREGVDALRDALNRLAQAESDSAKEAQRGGGIVQGRHVEEATKDLEGVIKSYARIKEQVDSTTQSVYEYVKATNASKTKVSLADMAQEFGDNFADMKKVLGRNFTDKVKSTEKGVQDLEQYIRELNGELGTHFNTDNISEGFKELVETVDRAKNATVSYHEALNRGFIYEDQARKEASFYNKELSDIVTNQEKLIQSNGIEKLTESLKSLADVKLPDFGPMAKSLEILTKLPIDKVVKNIDVIKKALNGTLETAEGVKNEATEVANEAEEGADRVVDGVNKVDNAFIRLAKRIQALDKNKIKEFGETFKSIGELVGYVAKAFEKMASVAKKAFMAMVSQLRILEKFGKLLVEDIKEKTDGIRSLIKKLKSNFESQVKKMSAFWKRAMKTFTFMLVRKAITAVIDNIKEAIQELAKFEKYTDNLSNGRFNDSLSEIVANFQWIGRSIVAAFEPLINFVVPALNAVAERITSIMAMVSEFMAALTGQSYYVVAKKTVKDYAESLENANKKAKEHKKLLLGIDELNTLSKDNDSSSSNDDDTGYRDAYETKPVSDKFQGLANKIREIFADLFEPLKKAWDQAGKYVIDGFEYMTSEIGKLGKSVWRDFITVWKQDATVDIFKNLLLIVGDLERVVGNLAKKFREAWDSLTDEGISRGQAILEDIRNIIGTVVEHVRNVTKYMVEWSDKLNFNPLLESVDKFLKHVNKVADFLGGVFEDVMQRVVLEHIRWLIEEGIPHLLEAFDRVVDAFNFEQLRKDLQPLMDAFETMNKNIHEGLVNAMERIGTAIADWTKSDSFKQFCETLVNLMGKITPERVEKLFSGLGLGILNIVQALADFVSSEEFNAFIDEIIAWFDSLSAEDIAGFFTGIAEGIGKIATDLGKFVTSDAFKSFVDKIIQFVQSEGAEGIADKLEKLAIAIAAFSFVSFVGSGIAGFFKFIGTITTVRNLTTIAKGLEAVGAGASAAGAGASAAGMGLLGYLGIAAAEGVVLAADLENLADASEGYAQAQEAHANETEKALSTLERLYSEKGPAIAEEWAKTAYDIDITGQSLEQAQATLTEKIDSMWDGVPQNMWEGFEQGWNYYFGEGGQGLGALCIDAFTDLVGGIEKALGISSPSTVMEDIGKYMVEGLDIGFTDAFNNLLDTITVTLETFTQTIVDSAVAFKDEVVGKYEEFKTAAIEQFEGFKESATKAFGDAQKAISDKAKEIVNNAKEKFNELKTMAKEKFEAVKQQISDKMNNSLEVVDQRLQKLKERFQKLDLTRIASNIIKGFTSGLRGAWGEVISWASEAVANLKAKFAEALQIRSPSRVFMEFGKYTVEGFNEGISKFQDTSSKVVNDWVASFSGMEVDLEPSFTSNIKDVPKFESADLSSTGSSLTKEDLMGVLTTFATMLNSSKGDTKIILEMDGRKVYEQVVKEDKQQVLRTGKSSFAY